MQDVYSFAAGIPIEYQPGRTLELTTNDSMELGNQHSLVRNRPMANHHQPQRLMAAWSSAAAPLTWPSHTTRYGAVFDAVPRPQTRDLPAALKNASTWSPLTADGTGPSAPSLTCPRSSHRKATVRAVSEATNHRTPSRTGSMVEVLRFTGHRVLPDPSRLCALGEQSTTMGLKSTPYLLAVFRMLPSQSTKTSFWS